MNQQPQIPPAVRRCRTCEKSNLLLFRIPCCNYSMCLECIHTFQACPVSGNLDIQYVAMRNQLEALRAPMVAPLPSISDQINHGVALPLLPNNPHRPQILPVRQRDNQLLSSVGERNILVKLSRVDVPQVITYDLFGFKSWAITVLKQENLVLPIIQSGVAKFSHQPLTPQLFDLIKHHCILECRNIAVSGEVYQNQIVNCPIVIWHRLKQMYLSNKTIVDNIGEFIEEEYIPFVTKINLLFRMLRRKITLEKGLFLFFLFLILLYNSTLLRYYTRRSWRYLGDGFLEDIFNYVFLTVSRIQELCVDIFGVDPLLEY